MSIQSSIDNAKQIDGWMLPSELEWLAEQASKANTIIEVGSYKGKSTSVLCDSTSGIVFSVDPFEDEYFDNSNNKILDIGDSVRNEFYKNLQGHFATGKLVHFRKTLNQIPNILKADFIFIDGDHRYYSVKEDIRAALGHAKQGTIISGHDYGDWAWPGVKQAVDEAFDNINVTQTIWWTRV